jgi:3-hydroxyacyl-CoA dehydrogenase
MSELDSLYSALKADLKDNVANQEVIEAIIENYRLRIAILEELLAELKPQDGMCVSKMNSYDL